MYEPSVLLEGVDDRIVPFLLLSAVSFCGMFVWYREALGAAARDRWISMPPLITMAWLWHDATIVARFPDWFGGRYDHWLMQLYWVAMVGTAVVEVVFVGQLLRFGREELAPRLAERTYRCGVVAVLGATLVVWLVVKRYLADDLFQVTFGLTASMYPPLGMALLLRRGDRRGQTVAQWAGFTTAVSGWWLAGYVAFGPAFRSAIWVLLGLTTAALGTLVTVLVARTPAPVRRDLARLPTGGPVR